MKGILKALAIPLWWLWVRVMFARCVWRAVLVELDQEDLSGTVVETTLEVHYLRQAVKARWGWNEPPALVEAYLQKVADERAKELASRQ